MDKKTKKMQENDTLDLMENYGEKYALSDIAVAQNFKGSVIWEGNYGVRLDGEFGESFRQILCFRSSRPIDSGQVVELWLEYKCDPSVEVYLDVTLFAQGTVDRVLQNHTFDMQQLKETVKIDNREEAGYYVVSLYARGLGEFQLIALHSRPSQVDCGAFLPDGKRIVTSDREEIFYYFDPGDGKPPLNVYFAGYKTYEGFEGFRLMKSKGCPFLLIAEARLEGGAFYIGSEEFESEVAGIISKSMEQLQFSADEVILSGISMGAFGALYYGSDILPHAIIAGKPLVNIGNVAAAQKHIRPKEFATSLDILRYVAGGMDAAAIMRLNKKFWDRFDRAEWNRTRFILSYMIEDDYDATAYQDILSHLHSEGAQIYGKGIHGRHNDNTQTVFRWFDSQYDKLLREDFERKMGT